MTPPRARQPRPAATLVILRDEPEGPRVLLTVRPRTMRFMGGATVFPGGAIAAADLDPRWERASVLSARDAAGALGGLAERAALGAYVCALRESFEEVGFPVTSGREVGLQRSAAEDPGAWVEHCLEQGVVLATDRLVPAGRWVTPLGAPVRFDAVFFLTIAPAGWAPRPDPREVESCGWYSPAEALQRMGAGEALMAPPTVEMLQLLAGYGSAPEALRGIESRRMDGPGKVLSARLSPLVQVVLAPNPGLMTGPGTNTYIVGEEPSLVIDPAVDDESYIDAVLGAAGDIGQILVTHRHADHVGGAARLGSLSGAPIRGWGADPAGGADVDPLEDGQRLEAGGVTLRALHTPGHAADHLSYLIEGAAGLFSGDNILGEGTSVIAPPEGNMRDFLSSLRRLAGLDVDRIYPGHFRPLDGGSEVIEELIAHRKEREAAVVDAVARGLAEPEQIVAAVYADTPPALHPVARFSVLAHLEMLEEEAAVHRVDHRWLPGSRG